MLFEPIFIHQRIVSPHMAGLARALADTGRSVTYCAEMEMSPARAAMGWTVPDLGRAALRIVPDAEAARALAAEAPANAIHICQGVRGNGLVKTTQEALARSGSRQWVIMETVEDDGWSGVARRLVYNYRFRHLRTHLLGVLAIGHRTPEWLVARGIPAERVYPFAYFLPETRDAPLPPEPAVLQPFRFLFVGQFIERKRLDDLIDALAVFGGTAFTLTVIGAGPDEAISRSRAISRLGANRLHWVGTVPNYDVPMHMVNADCLVLPSRYDGWGAVVSEALMAGTPVVCSDACGAAGAAIASGEGSVFPGGDVAALTRSLRKHLEKGPPGAARRQRLSQWAHALAAPAGAQYLYEVFAHQCEGTPRPVPPWMVPLAQGPSCQ